MKDEHSDQTVKMIYALENQDGLSDWETGLMTSVTDRFVTQQKPLTPAQFAALERLYRKFN